MINVSRKIEVNPNNNAVKLNRHQVWLGLERKAKNAVPFVPAISKCTVLQQNQDKLLREIVLNGETLQEMVLFFPESSVEFVRLSGQAMGVIKNIIEEDNEGLYLRFTFDLVLNDVEAGSSEEKAFSEGMEQAYLAAVDSTLKRIREEVSASVPS